VNALKNAFDILDKKIPLVRLQIPFLSEVKLHAKHVSLVYVEHLNWYVKVLSQSHELHFGFTIVQYFSTESISATK